MRVPTNVLLVSMALSLPVGAAAQGQSQEKLFHKPGLVYLWALNDDCSDSKIDRFVDAFAEGDAAAVCLHPRPGLLKPYGGDAWFAFIQRTVERCAARGLDVWLYDEDPFPSGNAGGWVTLEHPEFEAMQIRRFEPAAAPERQGLYCFPAGIPLWCGLVKESSGETVDLTGQVGFVRRNWFKLDPWDSRYYYPATPLHPCPRAWTKDPELAVEVKEVPAGFKLLAFVAQPVAGEAWAWEPDRLNPEATQSFLRHTHERYFATVGRHFGKTIRAIFTDEPKYSSRFPWTRGIFDAFRARFGYELPPRLWRLFAGTMDETSVQTRLDYRAWCGDRFREAWLQPVSRWCREHQLALVGHISPEDDPVQQNECVSNLFPLYPEFTLPGLDLIIPAVGDDRDGLINIGVLSAVSAAQQLGKAGVMSESLACSGLDFTAEQAGRILRWQLVMGVTTPVVHCAYNSTEGLRLIDAPPDFGPDSSRWPGMVALGRELASLQEYVRGATQIAPVAVVWPIRSFAAQPPGEFTADSPLRNDLVSLLTLCLDHQVGLQFIDEADLGRAQLADRQLVLGRARYSHLVIPSCLVLHAKTVAGLRAAWNAGVTVIRTGTPPRWQQTDTGLEPLALDWCPVAEPAELVKRLPRLISLAPDGTDIRCTAWRRDGQTSHLVVSLRDQPADVTIDGRQEKLLNGKILVSPASRASATQPKPD
jgi:hypothetical protein